VANKIIPSYALYGDEAQGQSHNLFDFEWIPKRSRPYNWNIAAHKHEAFIQILYVTEGGGTVFLDGARMQAKAPALIVIPAQTVHGFVFDPATDGAVVTAAQGPLESVASVLMPALLNLVRKPALLGLDGVPDHGNTMLPIFLAIERETRTPAMGQMAAGLSLLTALCVQIARVAEAQLSQARPENLRRVGQIEKFRSLVEQHYKSHWPVTQYASQLGITAGQLGRLCREELGMSSTDVINARLVHEAQRGLIYTASSIKQLSFALGFADETYFGRFFRKHTQLTPREFRAKALEALRIKDSL